MNADKAKITGWAPGMLQDDSRELSRWLAAKPNAKQEAREAAAGIAPVAEPAAEGWISVEDRLPEVGQEVLVYRPLAHESHDPHFTLDTFTARVRHYSPQNVAHGFSRWCHPSHWMPLPSAPPTAAAATHPKEGT